MRNVRSLSILESLTLESLVLSLFSVEQYILFLLCANDIVLYWKLYWNEAGRLWKLYWNEARGMWKLYCNEARRMWTLHWNEARRL